MDTLTVVRLFLPGERLLAFHSFARHVFSRRDGS
jgi:hypothetical protein